jgi:hypothetical protein
MKLKPYKEGTPIPNDFWNYDLNIILGYSVRTPRDFKQEANKYGVTPKGDI